MKLWKGNRRVYVTADTHFGDPLALRKFERPFASADAMDDAMIAAINARVGSDDVLLHLGDFGGDREWSKSERDELLAVRSRLACQSIVLVRGNLDPVGEPWFDQLFKAVHDVLTWKGWPDATGPWPLRVVACHYPLRQWQGWARGAVHLYGHVHGGLPELGRSTDVGVDCWGFAPLDLAALLEQLAGRPFEAPAEWPRIQDIRTAP